MRVWYRGWMSCAAFTFLGLWATYAKKDAAWIIWSSFWLAVTFLMIAGYRAWLQKHLAWTDENLKVRKMTEEFNVTVQVHGIPAHMHVDDQLFVIFPDVSMANQSRELSAAIKADLFMIREHGILAWCSPEASPLRVWEDSERSIRNKHLLIPVNLTPRSADNGYLAFSHRVLRGIANRPLVDEHGYYRYRIDFKNMHTDATFYQKEFSIAPGGF